MDIVVFGAGSLGSLVGGLLARTHRVTLVGRQPHVDAIRAEGLRVTGETTVEVHPDARTEPPPEADLAVVTVKAFDTDAAASALAPTSLAGCLSLQNGMGNEAVLARHLECPVLAGTCTYGARLAAPGHVRCTGRGEVFLGPRAGGHSALADEVGAAFTGADVRTTVATDMPRRLWEKLAVNAGINPTTALAGIPNGALADGPGRSTALAAACEVTRVAQAHGIDLEQDRAVTALLEVVDATAENVSSMLQDVRAGRRTEVDAINGFVVEAADEPVPVNETLAALIRATEAGSRKDG